MSSDFRAWSMVDQSSPVWYLDHGQWAGKQHGGATGRGNAQDAARCVPFRPELPRAGPADPLLGGGPRTGWPAFDWVEGAGWRGLLTVLRVDEGQLENAGRHGVAGWFLMGMITARIPA